MDQGRVVWSAAYGLRREPDLPMDARDHHVGRVDHQGVFATYVMQLVERGEFDLDVPVARQLPKPLDQYEPYKETATELVRDSAWPRVTPRMLLAHASGLQNFAASNPTRNCTCTSPGNRFPLFRRGHQPGAVRDRAKEGHHRSTH